MIIRTVSAVERADVVVLVIDAVEGVTEQDAKIAGIAHDRGKALSSQSTNGTRLRRTTRPFTVLQSGCATHSPLCSMRRSYLYLRSQVND